MIRKIIFIVLILIIGFLCGILFFNFFIESKISFSYPNLTFPDKKIIKNEKEREIKIVPFFEELKNEIISQKATSSFLEINFPEMKTRIWQEGELKKEVEILAKGDPQEWGGTAAGLYKIISKYRIAFSAIAEVYMPYAMNFYGKYYLHGVPYYEEGNKRFVNVTGGCVQLSDKDSETIFNLTEKEIPVLVIDKYKDNYLPYFKKEISDFPSLSAKSYLVADLDSGFVLADKKMEEKHPIASLTQLMTAVAVAENIDLRRSIEITPSMLKPLGTTTGLVSGKTFKVVDLFYPMLIESSNDAAEVVSNLLGREKTIRLMNEKAKAILMQDTIFVDPHGLSEENISTPRDLFYLARYILNNRPPIWKITKEEKVNSYGELTFTGLLNKNLFSTDTDFIGGKTGYIKESKYNGIFLFEFSDKDNIKRKIVIILLGSENWLTDSDSLKDDANKTIDWVKTNFFTKEEVKNN
ncbi:MAG: L,D-transpeptidase family protein [Candidatus Nealsonbacteria bacterium]|nr:L,D-transpeptidase family protein [Candidatus Nealsonbacteria bacterium]